MAMESHNGDTPPPLVTTGPLAGALNGMKTFRIYSKAEENCSLTIRDGIVVLATDDPSDEYQHWIKDDKFSTLMRDEKGFPSFALVNKATGMAIKHPIKPYHYPVQLIPYNPEYLDQLVLWTKVDDNLQREGFHGIMMISNVDYVLDAYMDDEGFRDGTVVGLCGKTNGCNQFWKITPHFLESHKGDIPPSMNGTKTFRVYTKAAENCSLTVRDGIVVLATTDPCDDHQHWIKDEKFATIMGNKKGLGSSFALVNKATGMAMKHPVEPYQYPVQLIPYNPEYLDQSVLWTEVDDDLQRQDFHKIRMISNMDYNLDAYWDGGGFRDGTVVGLYEQNNGNNQLWKITPYCKFPGGTKMMKDPFEAALEEQHLDSPPESPLPAEDDSIHVQQQQPQQHDADDDLDPNLNSSDHPFSSSSTAATVTPASVVGGSGGTGRGKDEDEEEDEEENMDLELRRISSGDPDKMAKMQ